MEYIGQSDLKSPFWAPKKMKTKTDRFSGLIYFILKGWDVWQNLRHLTHWLNIWLV